jgi:hypothetical protein
MTASVNLSFHPKVNNIKWSLRNRGKLFCQIQNQWLKSQNLKNKDKITLSLQNKGMNAKGPIFNASDILL